MSKIHFLISHNYSHYIRLVIRIFIRSGTINQSRVFMHCTFDTSSIYKNRAL